MVLRVDLVCILLDLKHLTEQLTVEVNTNNLEIYLFSTSFLVVGGYLDTEFFSRMPWLFFALFLNLFLLKDAFLCRLFCLNEVVHLSG
jgi:hypothetical protein